MYEDIFTPLEPLDELQLAAPQPVDVEGMLVLLDHADPSLRMQAARVFCDLEEPRAVARLIDLLADPCPLVRVSAAYALGRNPDPSAVPVLIEALQWDWNGYVRKGVVWALGNARDLRALPVLILALRSDITAVRLWAASALGQLATRGRRLPEISAALIEGLRRDGAAAVRSNCAWSLGQLGDHLATGSEAQACRQALKTALKTDPDLGVQDDAQIALEKWGEPEETEDSEEFDFG